MNENEKPTFAEFCELLGEPVLEPVPETHLQANRFDAFMFFMFLSLFDKDDPAGVFMAAALAHSWASNLENYPKALSLSNRACALRWKRRSVVSRKLKM